MGDVTKMPEDYGALKKEYLSLRKELDEVNQDLYGSKRQLKILEALQVEYQSEIDVLQSEDDSEKKKLQDKISHLEETINAMRQNYSEQSQAFQLELAKKEEENETLQSEIEFLKKVNPADSIVDDTSKLFDEITVLRQENERLLKNEEEMKLSVDILTSNNSELKNTLAEYREELDSLKESLVCKRDELLEAKDSIQKLTDQVFCLTAELDSYKNKPLNEKSKGNSLFAEVDDRRVYLQKTISIMKTDYVSMKQERAKHTNLISHLRKENKELCDRWKTDVEEKEDDEYMVLKAYK